MYILANDNTELNMQSQCAVKSEFAVSNRRGGMILFTLLAILAVVSIFSFTINSLARQKMFQNKQLLDRLNCMVLAQSALNYSAANLQEELEKRPSAIAEFFLRPDVSPDQLVLLPLPLLPELTAKYPDSEVKIQIKILASKVLQKAEDLNISGFDPLEKLFQIELSAAARTGLIACNLSEIREVRLTNLVPGLAGKFTLYVKSVNKSDSLNKFACHIDGYPDSAFSEGVSCMPVILKNGGELDFAATEGNDSSSWQKRGYVFLGGEAVDLNLTSGNFEAFGELFHFYSLDRNSNIPGYFDAVVPTFFSATPDFASKWAQTLNAGDPFASEFAYILKHVVTGYYTTQDDGSDMNYDQRLELSFPTDQPASRIKMQSSSLHLFGTRSNPSPTLVLGNVNRRYADFTGIVVDVDGDGQRDAIVDYVKETSLSPSDIPSPPEEVYAMPGGCLEQGHPIKLDTGLLSYSNMFGSAQMYQEHMCKIITEPYLRSHDFLFFSTEDDFFPTKSCFGDEAAEYQQSFSLKFDTGLFSDRFFYENGNPQAYTHQGLAHKFAYRVTSFNDFLARFYDSKSSILDLAFPIIVENPDGKTVKLPDNIKIASSSMLMLANGDLELGAIEQRNSDAMLTIILEKGSFILDNPGQKPVCANLVAMNGMLKNKITSHALDLQGSLLVASYEPEQFKNGGKIVYDDRSDPSGEAYQNYYRCYVADYALDMKKSITILND
ncbi:MAG: hypothetical protein CVV42_10440 [Candidatus Riflebacteria bacterium HGW-Riflebacteria-2]|nr:MAG: hypothetical protein CVV42_10440 [Candidatus Riflebacteria bacterium HGW-Riflebacteria-2]